jgi:hypothetical protein
MRGQFTPPIASEGDNCEPPVLYAAPGRGPEFFFDRRLGDAPDKQVNYQAPGLNYLFSAYSESMPQAQPLCLYF